MRGTSWLIPLAILGVAAILYVSPWGVAVTHDSVLYLSAGENLSQGLGMQRAGPNGELRPIAHYPPLYPMLLAALLLLGMDEVHAATWLSAVLFGVNIGIAGMIVLWLTRRLHGALLAQFAILVSPVMLETHLNALSEPLFFTWLLLNLWLLAMYLETQRRPLLIAAGVACSLASLSRYVGGALGGAGIVILALRRRTPIKRRLEDVAILAGVSLCPLLLWYVRNLILAGSSANRALVYHPVSYLVLRAAFDTLSGRLLPEQSSDQSSALAGQCVLRRLPCSLGIGGVTPDRVQPSGGGRIREKVPPMGLDLESVHRHLHRGCRLLAGFLGCLDEDRRSHSVSDLLSPCDLCPWVRLGTRAPREAHRHCVLRSPCGHLCYSQLAAFGRHSLEWKRIQ